MKSTPTKSTGSLSQIAFTSDYEGQCCSYDTTKPAAGKEYHILVCRSSKATGGFVDKDGVDCTNGGGTVVPESHGEVYGPVGQGVYDDTTYGPILYYHYGEHIPFYYFT
ncbi:unnamed protein product [Phytophthora fragariaefolia]|uniref:Unnamed protein product n=1 Tax=Phytophthora fragariaefolia TaxID=1490495 RepID=A0A9W7CUE6_9STRA|nr:unnamed protein product [Phytophthora fragariaefolia]